MKPRKRATGPTEQSSSSFEEWGSHWLPNLSKQVQWITSTSLNQVPEIPGDIEAALLRDPSLSLKTYDDILERTGYSRAASAAEVDELREKFDELSMRLSEPGQPVKSSGEKQAKKIIFPKRGEFLKRVRNEAGAAVKTFQRELHLLGDKGISARSLSNIEKGFKVKPETLKAYMEVLNKLRKAAKLKKITAGDLPKN